jgi:acetyltransferase-like isoleucine patch superfamily enzyme
VFKINRLKKKISYNLFLSGINSIYRNYFTTKRSRFGYIDNSARVRFPILIKGIENVFLYENVVILGHSVIITTKAKFIMKKNAAAAEGLTVVTGNHPADIGMSNLQITTGDIQEAKDVIVEEEVWLAANVTLLSGVVVGRGAVIGSGAVCRKNIPPYAIVIGNPARIVGFKFRPDEIIEHEKILYAKEERLSIELLNKNYEKYFLNKITEIRSFLN